MTTFNESAAHDALMAIQNENTRLRKDNFKLADKIKKIESGNFDEFFVYSTLEIELPPKGSCTQTIKITNAADFYVTKITRTGRGFSFLISDSSNERQWSNIHLDARLGAGTAGLPLILPKPKFIARASTITIDLVNKLDTPNVVSMAFVGYKVFHVTDLTDDEQEGTT